MIDLQVIQARAAVRMAVQQAPTLANAAKRLIDGPAISHLATLAGGAACSATPADLDLSAVAWTDDDIARFCARRERLLRWGWAEKDAEALADRLTRRDREADPHVSCTDCRHFMPWRCGNHTAAMLMSREVGRDLASMPQDCPGHELREEG